MTKEEFKKILDVFITARRIRSELIRTLIGGDETATPINEDALFSKIERFENIIKEHSLFAGPRTDEAYANLFKIIDSSQLSLDEKVDKLYKE
ncbi:MAG: hypothetical protein K6G88_11775 [Lachnospiraceae bacterium]|nr:hypothetical protein [Lachnospiraceae bacterium]